MTAAPGAAAPPLQEQLAAARHAAAAAQREMSNLRRQLQTESIAAARQHVRHAKGEAGAAVRAALTEARDETAGVSRASPAAVADVAHRLYAQLRFLEPDPLKASWFTLFKSMDTDGSGLVSWHEFRTMVRSVLKLGADAMPDKELMAVWNALDADGSGHVSAGEFGRFMSPRTTVPRRHGREGQASAAADPDASGRSSVPLVRYGRPFERTPSWRSRAIDAKAQVRHLATSAVTSRDLP